MRLNIEERSQLLREVSSLRQDFERLYLANAKGVLFTEREATLSRTAIPKPSMTVTQLNRLKDRRTHIISANGMELMERRPQTFEEWRSAPIFYFRRTGEPFVNSVGHSMATDSGWNSTHSLELSGDHSSESKAAIDRANEWVTKRHVFIWKALFSDRNATFSEYSWPDVVLQVADKPDATTSTTKWCVDIGSVQILEVDGIECLISSTTASSTSWTTEIWRQRNNQLAELKDIPPFSRITKADELYIGNEPEISYCRRELKTFLRDSELVLDWFSRLIDRCGIDEAKNKKPAVKKSSKRGRKQVTKATQNADEKVVWEMHSDLKRSAAYIADEYYGDLSRQPDVQKIIDRVRQRMKRINSRKAD